jgi:hypothetical protein
MPKGYTDKTTIENYLIQTIDTSFDSQIDAWIEAAENFIDQDTSQIFIKKTATRYFDGNGQRELVIDSFRSITSLDILEVDGTTLLSLTEGPADDFLSFPYNEDTKYKLILTNTSQIGAFLSGHRRIKIVADWGEASTVPADIKLACTLLVADLIRRSQRGGGTISSESLGDYSVSYGNFDESAKELGVKKILDHYRIFEL